MKRITMLTDGVGGNGEALVSGQSYDLEDASADHWLKRGKAVLAVEEGTGGGNEVVVKPLSEGLTVAEIKEELAKRQIEIPEGVTLKADLAALLDAAVEEGTGG